MRSAGKPAARSSFASASGSGKRARSIGASDGKKRRRPTPLEGIRRKRRQHHPAARSEHPVELTERPIALDEMDAQPEDGPLEPVAPERERLGLSLLQADAARKAPARLGEHLGRGVDAPHLRPALREKRRQPAGAAADVEHAPALELAFLDDRLGDLLPVRVGRAQRVVARRERPEVRPCATRRR